jgi:hypothetical protein
MKMTADHANLAYRAGGAYVRRLSETQEMGFGANNRVAKRSRPARPKRCQFTAETSHTGLGTIPGHAFQRMEG